MRYIHHFNYHFDNQRQNFLQYNSLSCIMKLTLYNFHLITGMERRKHEMERLGLWRCTRPQNTAESAVETRRSYV